MVDYNEFAEKFKAKNPDYADRDNRTLAEALIKKHPEYADRITFDSGTPDANFILNDKAMADKVTPTEPTFGETVKSSMGQLLPSVQNLRDVTHGMDVATNMPMRGLRGIGVAAEQSLLGKSPEETMQRASAATQQGYVPQPGEKLGSFAGEMADPRNIVGGEALGLGAKMAGEGISKLGGAMESMGTKGINHILGIRPVTLGTIGRAGEAPADVGVEVGKLLARDNVVAGSDKQVFTNFNKGLEKAGKKVKSTLDQITEGKPVEMPATEALQPLFDAYQKIGSAMTSTRRAMAKPFKDIFGSLVEKSATKGNNIGLDDIRDAMNEVGPMTHKGAEETQAIMSELYGKLADVQDHMITSTANVAKNPMLKEQLLEANRDFSIYSRIAHDVKHTLNKAAVEPLAKLSTPGQSLEKLLSTHLASPITKMGSALKGFPITAQNANAEVLQGLKNRLGNQKGSFTLGPESRQFNPGMEIRKMWGDKAKAEQTDINQIAEYVHPEVFQSAATQASKVTAKNLPIINPADVPKDKPYAIYIGSSKPYEGMPGLDYYDIHGAGGPISESNKMPTMAVSSKKDLKNMAKKGIKIIGKKERAGDQTPQHGI